MSEAFDYSHDPLDFERIVCENVRAEAARRGYNQSSLAKELGITQSAVGQRWRGNRAWPFDDLARVASIFEMTPWDLCTPPEYRNGPKPKLEAVDWLPRLDSNQQPFD